MKREPGLKAQVAAGIVAIVTFVLQRVLGLAPDDPFMQSLAPLIAYTAAQIAGWLWARTRTTPVADPKLPEGQRVTLDDGTTGRVERL